MKIRVVIEDEQMGVMKTRDALMKARAMGVDLVEIASNANPPVCRLVDYGKYKYEISKQKKANEKNQKRIKEIKLRPGIDPHDYTTKMARAEKFLDAGHKIRVQLMFRGREFAHKELGYDMMKQVIEDLKGVSHVDLEPRKSGRGVGMLLSPLPKEQRTLKYADPKVEVSDESNEEKAPFFL